MDAEIIPRRLFELSTLMYTAKDCPSSADRVAKKRGSFTIARLYCTYRECRVGYIATDLKSYPMIACTKQRRFKGSAPVALEPQPDFSRHTRFKSKVSIAPTPIYIASLKHTHIQAHTFLLPNTHTFMLPSTHTHIHV